MEGKALHDKLLENLPTGAVHRMEDCQWCLLDAGLNNGGAPGASGGGGAVTITQEDIDRAVAAAQAEKDAEIAKLQEALSSKEIDQKVTAAVEAKDTEIAELKQKLDAAELEAQTAKAAAEKVEQDRAKEQADREEAERLADVKKTRLAELADLQLPFTAEQVEAKADGWARLTDEEWTDRKTEWAEIAGRAGGTGSGTGGLGGFRETDSLGHRQGGNGSKPSDVMGAIRELASAGVDPRTMH